MEGILALMIPIIVVATGFVAVLKRPSQPSRGQVGPGPEVAALADEVAQLRLELAEARERIDFTEKLLMGPKPTPGLPRTAPAEPAHASAGA